MKGQTETKIYTQTESISLSSFSLVIKFNGISAPVVYSIQIQFIYIYIYIYIYTK